MNKNLLIVGAGIYGVVAKEIAESMNCFEKIAFVDDGKKETPNGIKVIGTGCIISAGAVVNHASMCCDGVHVDCNATVAGFTLVPVGMKIKSGEVYDRKIVNPNDLFFDPEEWEKRLGQIQQSTISNDLNTEWARKYKEENGVELSFF